MVGVGCCFYLIKRDIEIPRKSGFCVRMDSFRHVRRNLRVAQSSSGSRRCRMMMLIARQLDDARLSKSSRSSVCIRRRNQKRIGNKSFSEREKKLLFCLVLWGFGLIMASFIDRLRFSHSRPNRVGPPCSFSFGAGHLFCVLLLFSQMMAFFSSISAALSYSLVAD